MILSPLSIAFGGGEGEDQAYVRQLKRNAMRSAPPFLLLATIIGILMYFTIEILLPLLLKIYKD